MAITKKETEEVKNGRVSINVPRGEAQGDPNYFICVNGTAYLLPRGKTSEVPPEVAAEFYRAEKAKEAFYEKEDALRNKG